MEKQQAQVGAKWWADCIRNGSKMDNADDSEMGDIISSMATMLQESCLDRITSQQADTFEFVLSNAIMMLDSQWDTIRVDYHADYTLTQAGEYAGIDVDFGVLPWKTTMSFEDDGVQVCSSYCAPVEILLKAEK